MSRRERPRRAEADDSPGPEEQERREEFIDEVIRRAAGRHRAAVAAGMVDPVVLILDPAYPRARAIAEAAATPVAVAEAIGSLRRRGIEGALLFYPRPRPLVVALLAPAFPATAAEVAARTGPGWVLAGDTALACHIESADREP